MEQMPVYNAVFRIDRCHKYLEEQELTLSLHENSLFTDDTLDA
jgi:hypothetical protein